MDPTDCQPSDDRRAQHRGDRRGPHHRVRGDPVARRATASWQQVYDLGTQKHRGDASATASTDRPANQLSALDLSGDNAYAGFCGYCDTITQPVSATAPFANGIATNVGGARRRSGSTSQGWHIATATGLPNRYITSVASTRPTRARSTSRSPATAGTGRCPARWATTPARSAPATCSSPPMPATPSPTSAATCPTSRPTPCSCATGQLVVGTDIGVFASSDTNGSHWAVLGLGTADRADRAHRAAPGRPQHARRRHLRSRRVHLRFPQRAEHKLNRIGSSRRRRCRPAHAGPQLRGAPARPTTCAPRARRLTYRVNPVPHGRVVRVDVFVQTRGGFRFVLVRRGRSVSSVSIPRPSTPNFVVKIISTNNRGGRVITTRGYRGCVGTPVRGHVKRHRTSHRAPRR